MDTNSSSIEHALNALFPLTCLPYYPSGRTFCEKVPTGRARGYLLQRYAGLSSHRCPAPRSWLRFLQCSLFAFCLLPHLVLTPAEDIAPKFAIFFESAATRIFIYSTIFRWYHYASKCINIWTSFQASWFLSFILYVQ